jgi:AraC-like DNA-binding protein
MVRPGVELQPVTEQMLPSGLGISFSDYLIQLRIIDSKMLLSQTDLQINEIAAQLHFSNAQNFIRAFKKITSMTPGQYRNNTMRQWG